MTVARWAAPRGFVWERERGRHSGVFWAVYMGIKCSTNAHAHKPKREQVVVCVVPALRRMPPPLVEDERRHSVIKTQNRLDALTHHLRYAQRASHDKRRKLRASNVYEMGCNFMTYLKLCYTQRAAAQPLSRGKRTPHTMLSQLYRTIFRTEALLGARPFRAAARANS